MRIKLTTTKLACGREWQIEIERGLTAADETRMAAERENRYLMALEAIAAAPGYAAEIAREAI